MLDSLFQDFRFALRVLRKRPGVSLLIVLTLGLGIGANTAIFSVVHATLLRPLPFRDADRLIKIEAIQGGEAGLISMREVEDLRQQVKAFVGVAAYLPGVLFNLSGEGRPEEVPAILPTHNLFQVLGVELAHGKVWPAEFDRRRDFGVLLSHDLWQRKFGGDPSLVGRSITLDRSSAYVVFGILPPGFAFPRDTEVYRSIFIAPVFPDLENRQARRAEVIARLADGATAAQAAAEVRAFGERLASQFPDSNGGISFRVTPLRDSFVGPVRPYLILLLAAVSLVLLIACVNVANLLLSQALAREGEVAVRAALGAGRGRITRQLLVESLLLALTGAAVGVLFAFLWLRALRQVARFDLPAWMTFELNLPVLVFTAVVATVTGLVAGLVPALRMGSTSVLDLSRGLFGGRRQQGLRRMLVVAEVALSVVLLAGAGLLLRSFNEMTRVDLGFERERLLSFRVALPWTFDRPAILDFHRRALERLEALPGVKSAALSSNLPLAGLEGGEQSALHVEGQPIDEQERNPLVTVQRASQGYFQTLGIPLRAGRAFDDRDRDGAARVAIVNERLAERLWPGQDPLGRRIKQGVREGEWMTVIGVVGNIHHAAVGDASSHDVYIPARQMPNGWNHFVLRTEADPRALAQAATQTIWEVDPDQSVFDVRSMEQRVLDAVWQQRLAAFLFLVFAALAVALASLGLYGVMSFLVSQRRQETGVRMSLGAEPRQIRRQFLTEALHLTGVGLVTGLLSAVILARAIGSLLYDVEPFDPWAFGGACLILLAVALLASIIPAQRATRVDPVIALRAP